jgi:hypothetical protein
VLRENVVERGLAALHLKDHGPSEPARAEAGPRIGKLRRARLGGPAHKRASEPGSMIGLAPILDPNANRLSQMLKKAAETLRAEGHASGAPSTDRHRSLEGRHDGSYVGTTRPSGRALPFNARQTA